MKLSRSLPFPSLKTPFLSSCFDPLSVILATQPQQGVTFGEQNFAKRPNEKVTLITCAGSNHSMVARKVGNKGPPPPPPGKGGKAPLHVFGLGMLQQRLNDNVSVANSSSSGGPPPPPPPSKPIRLQTLRLNEGESLGGKPDLPPKASANKPSLPPKPQ